MKNSKREIENKIEMRRRLSKNLQAFGVILENLKGVRYILRNENVIKCVSLNTNKGDRLNYLSEK